MWPGARFQLLLLCGLSACAVNRGALLKVGAAEELRLAGLYPCSAHSPEVVALDPTRPVTVLVHGCNSSGERFKTLAAVFEAHGQQTLCFNYNDRDFLNTSATQLAEALSGLQKVLAPQQLTLLGHSQGGLVARRALQADLPQPLERKEGFSYRLVTVSSPFAGIASSADCGKTWLHVLSFSATVAVCLVVTGNKWPEIPPGSPFMTNRAKVASEGHLRIVTDERGTCRERRADGSCRVDDFVFALSEQDSPVVAAEPGEVRVQLEVGHAAVVGENETPPQALIEVLQAHGVLAQTPPAQRESLTALLQRLYSRR